MVKKIEKSLSNESINEELDSSICESIDEISNLEIERLEKEIKSKLNVDYETYIKQFWVGLLEGDGTITVSAPGANYVKVRFIISIKNLRENVLMLLLVQKVLGGTVKIERKAQYVTWIAIRKDLILSLIKLLEEYPLLTTRKQCQLEFAVKCIESGTKDFIVENRNFMYQDQPNKLNHFKCIDYLKPYVS